MPGATAEAADRIARRLWQGGSEASVYALLDGARDTRILPLIERSRLDYTSLFRGRLPRRLALASPYLVSLGRTSAFTAELLEAGWGGGWGYFVESPVILQDLRRHFRRFLQVEDPAGRRLFFRHYDPRVMRVFLPTCNAAELEFVFGPVRRFVIEDSRPDVLLEFDRSDGQLRARRVEFAGNP